MKRASCRWKRFRPWPRNWTRSRRMTCLCGSPLSRVSARARSPPCRSSTSTCDIPSCRFARTPRTRVRATSPARRSRSDPFETCRFWTTSCTRTSPPILKATRTSVTPTRCSGQGRCPGTTPTATRTASVTRAFTGTPSSLRPSAPGMTGLHFHELRHTFATVTPESGALDMEERGVRPQRAHRGSAAVALSDAGQTGRKARTRPDRVAGAAAGNPRGSRA